MGGGILYRETHVNNIAINNNYFNDIDEIIIVKYETNINKKHDEYVVYGCRCGLSQKDVYLLKILKNKKIKNDNIYMLL